MSEPINLIFLRATGFQRLTAVPVDVVFNPTGLTFIEGKNGSGKSSTLSPAFGNSGSAIISAGVTRSR